MTDKKMALYVDGAPGCAAAASLASNTAIVSVRCYWVSTTGGAIAAVRLFSAMAMIGFQRPQSNQ